MGRGGADRIRGQGGQRHRPGRQSRLSELVFRQPNGYLKVTPGSESGNPFGPFGNQLGLWLTDDDHGATTVRGEVLSDATLQEQFVPAP